MLDYILNDSHTERIKKIDKKINELLNVKRAISAEVEEVELKELRSMEWVKNCNGIFDIDNAFRGLYVIYLNKNEVPKTYSFESRVEGITLIKEGRLYVKFNEDDFNTYIEFSCLDSLKLFLEKYKFKSLSYNKGNLEALNLVHTIYGGLK